MDKLIILVESRDLLKVKDITIKEEMELLGSLKLIFTMDP